MEYCSNSVAETEELGAQLAARLRPGDVVAYTGDLGAGKTAFTRGIARGLGIPERVTSPTFTIVNEYEGGRLPLFHFDLYRLGDPEELFDIGWEDFLRRGGGRTHPGGHPPGGARRTACDLHPERAGDVTGTEERFREDRSRLQEKCVMKP
mgnify:CR=1 FL=1